jgi:hypothetical protein
VKRPRLGAAAFLLICYHFYMDSPPTAMMANLMGAGSRLQLYIRPLDEPLWARALMAIRPPAPH